jgi:hypothetical protein
MFNRCLVTIFFLTLNGCALFEDRKGPITFFGPREQVYYATYEEVWRASNLVLQSYPLKVSNMDQGLLETDAIRGLKVWTPPYKNEGSATAGESYKLTLKILKGGLNGKSATKVTVLKDDSIQHDFFSDPRPIPSDGLEEKSLLYRIGREIQTERALNKAQKRHKALN